MHNLGQKKDLRYIFKICNSSFVIVNLECKNRHEGLCGQGFKDVKGEGGVSVDLLGQTTGLVQTKYSN